MNDKVLKWVGLGVSAIGALASLVGSYISDKKTENEISKKVNEAVAKALIANKVNDAVITGVANALEDVNAGR